MLYKGKEVRRSIETYAKLKFLFYRCHDLALFDRYSEIDKIRFKNQIIISLNEYSSAIKDKRDLDIMQYCFGTFMLSDLWIPGFIETQIMGKVVTRQEVFRILNDYKCASYKYYEIDPILQTVKEFNYLFKFHPDETVTCTSFQYNKHRRAYDFEERRTWESLKELKKDNDFRVKYRSMRFIRIVPEKIQPIKRSRLLKNYKPQDSLATNA